MMKWFWLIVCIVYNIYTILSIKAEYDEGELCPLSFIVIGGQYLLSVYVMTQLYRF